MYYGDKVMESADKAYSLYFIDRAFTAMNDKLAAAHIEDVNFTEGTGWIIQDVAKTADLADVAKSGGSGRWCIELLDVHTGVDNDGIRDGYKKDLNVKFTAKFLGVTNSTWGYEKVYKFRVMSPILEGLAIAKNNLVEVSATGKTQITGEDIWAKTYNGDVEYGIFQTTVKDGTTYKAAWTRNDIVNVKFSTGNQNIFEVTTAVPTEPEFETDGTITKASYIEVEGVAAGTAKLNVAIKDIWGYTLNSQVDIKTTVNAGN